MNQPARRDNFRLTLAGFGEHETSDIVIMVRVVADAQVPWIVVGTPPYDAVLLACGTRDGDAENVSVLRVAREVDAENLPDNRRQLPLLLPRPIQDSSLRLALEVAMTRLQARGLDPRG